SFSATMNLTGNYVLTATDTASSSITGNNFIASRGLIVKNFTPTATGFTATFSKTFNQSVLNLYATASQAAAFGPSVTPASLADVTLVTVSGTTTTTISGSLLFDATGTQITFLKTGG